MEEFSIELGAKLKLDSLQEQINKASSNLKPLEITINTEKSEKKITALTEQISKLNNGFKIMENMGSLSSNLDVINKSLKSIATVIDKINKADGFNNLAKGLNSFAPVAETIKQELSSIKTAMESFKGLNINIGLGNSNPVAKMTQYGVSARETITELKKQEIEFDKLFSQYTGIQDGLAATMRAINTARTEIDGFTNSVSWFDEESNNRARYGAKSLSAQMAAWQEYIQYLQSVAKALNIDTSPIVSSANEIVTSTQKILTGENEVATQTEKLKGLFGSGIDAEKLTTQLDAIKVSIDNVSTAISGIKFDDSTLQAFRETIGSLNTTIQQLSKSITELDSKPIVSKTVTTGISQTTQEIKKAEAETQKLKQTTEQATKIDGSSTLAGKQTIEDFESKIRHLIYDEKELESKTKDFFGSIGTVTTNIVRGATNEITSFSVAIQELKNGLKTGVAETLRFSLKTDNDDKYYKYQGASSSDNYARQLETDRKQTERNTAAVTNYTSKLKILKDEYLDVNASKPIQNSKNIEHLNSLYDEAIAKVNTLGTATKESFASSEASVKAAIAEIRSQVKIYREVESMANQLRAKPIETIKGEQIQLLREFEAKIKSSGIALEQLKSYSISDLSIKLGGVTDRQSLTEYLNMFVVAKAEFKALQAEQKNYSQIQKASADKEKATLKEVENEYQNLISLVGQIGKKRISLFGLDSESEKDIPKITRIKEELRDLYTQYAKAKMTFTTNFPTYNLDELKVKWQEILRSIELAKNETIGNIAYKSSQEEINKEAVAYKELLSSFDKYKAERIALSKINPENPKYDVVREEVLRLVTDYRKLRAEFSKTYPTHNMDELRDKLHSLGYELRQVQGDNTNRANQQAVKDETTAYKELLSSFDKYKAERIALSKISKDSPEYSVVSQQVNKLLGDYQKLRTEFTANYPTHNLDELNAKLQELDYSLNRVQSKKTHKLNEKELAQLDVAEVERYNQTLKRMADEQNSRIIQEENQYKELISLVNQLGTAQKELSRTKIDSPEYDTVLSRVQQLSAAYQRAKMEFISAYPTHPLDELKAKLEEIGYVIQKNNDKQLGKQQTALFNELSRVSKEMDSIQIKLQTLKSASGTNEHTEQIKELERQLAKLETVYQEVMTQINNNGGLTDNQYAKIYTDIEMLDAKLKEISASAVDAQNKLKSSIKTDISNGTLKNQIQTIENDYRKLGLTEDEIAQKTQTLKSLLSTMDASDDIESVTKDYTTFGQEVVKVQNDVKALRREQQKAKDEANLANNRQTLNSQIDVWLKKNSAAASQFGVRLREIQQELLTADGTKLTALKREFQEIKRQAELAGKATMTLGDKLKSKLGSLATYFSATMMISYAIQGVRAMYQNVLDVDTAMTELYRVTDLTEKQYSQLYDKMVAGAKKYNAALNDIISATAEWVRFGFDTNLSEQLAELTVMYQHVTDLDHKLATENLLTAYKGFQPSLDAQFDGDAAAAVEHILDVYDKLNNELPVSAAQIAEGVNKTASVLEEAGATFEQASALIVGGGSVTQDFDAMGNSIKIATLRIHGMKGKLEELGEEVDENIQSVSKIQTQILNLTHGKVNIFEDDGEHFRNIYDVFKDIASVWDSLSDTESAELLELIAGIFYQNVQRCA